MNKQKIEDFGLFLEKYRFPPVAARIYALLILTEPHEFHFDEIQSFLKISKGATSGALRFLEVSKRVVQKTKPGLRKRFYCIGQLPGVESLQLFKSYIFELRNFQQLALNLKNENDIYTEKMQDSIDFCNKFLNVISILEEQYE